MSVYKDVQWWKAYVIYLIVFVPLVALVTWQIHAWWVWFIVAAIIFTGMAVMGPIQRKVWP